MAIEYDPSRDYYMVIGVLPNATPEEIKKAHRKAIKVAHPDRAAGDEVRAAELHARAAELNAAGTVLLDPEQRAAYDKVRDDWFAVARAKWAKPKRRKRKKTSPTSAMVPVQEVNDFTVEANRPITFDEALLGFVGQMRRPALGSLTWWLKSLGYGAIIANGLAPASKRSRPRPKPSGPRRPPKRAVAARMRARNARRSPKR